ncbi:ADP-ribosylation [Aaosphaeria arxii CBS 175.79]|uniref:ADP-ribosylation n=1 Tax=Aaosphaeria arxii CBS 175.79 TaxID=1450172 RepID=A0A6A5XI38_9PLEO|nr:ADP-ribosylation [Aaosphaeria arxii CBS 175.79]KAF2012481.1 ADP-ribosylation [Aaosphaeria arxii CBS 175.79]
MLLSKAFVLLGVLVTFSSSAPVAAPPDSAAPVDDEVDEAPPNDYPEKRRSMWRADGVEFQTLVDSGGFLSKAARNKVKPEYRLSHHVMESTGTLYSIKNTGYISTTSSFAQGKGMVNSLLKGNGYLYEIGYGRNLIDVNESLGKYNKFKSEKEFAAIQKIPLEQIKGYYKFTTNADGRLTKGVYKRNPHFKTMPYEFVQTSPGMTGPAQHGGPQYSLVGFPDDHEIWKQEPWSMYYDTRLKVDG